MGMENISGLMVENLQVIGYVIRCTDKAYSLGLMVESIRVITSMIKNKGMECSHGLMDDNMMEHG